MALARLLRRGSRVFLDWRVLFFVVIDNYVRMGAGEYIVKQIGMGPEEVTCVNYYGDLRSSILSYD